MKTYSVDPMAKRPVVLVWDGDQLSRREFRTKQAASKFILSLIREGYKFDNQAPKEATP